MRLYTIGFTQSTAEHFFGRLTGAGVERLLDIRLTTSSQLAGFAKVPDLAYFLRELAGVEYRHEPLLAPTRELFDHIKSRNGDWGRFESGFRALMAERRIETALDRGQLEATPTVLLCSEATAERCHRRLVCEYLSGHWDGLQEVDL